MTTTTTITATVGANVKRLRLARGLRQADLAAHMGVHGIEWTQATVAKVEAGKKAVTLEEFVVLGPALVAPVLDLLDGADTMTIGSSTYSAEQVRTVLAEPSKAGLLLFAKPASPEESAAHEAAREADARLVESKVAKRLTEALGREVDATLVARVAKSLWGRTSIAERRDLLMAERAPEVATPRTIQAIRGRVTRDLAEQIGDEIRRRGL